MSLFCFLWVPLFYFFCRSFSAEENPEGGVTALILGAVTAIVRFLLGTFISPGGFGLSRWVSGFIDIVSLPVLLPLFVYFLFIIFRIYANIGGFRNFALLWLIPVAAIRAVGWSAQGDPLLLVLPPVLWTALAAGIPFFIGLIAGGRSRLIIPALLCIAALPPLAATVYWAFFSQRMLMGWFFLALTLVPSVLSVVQGMRSSSI